MKSLIVIKLVVKDFNQIFFFAPFKSNKVYWIQTIYYWEKENWDTIILFGMEGYRLFVELWTLL